MQKTGTNPSPTAAIERHFSVPELSKLLNLDPRAVRRMFQDEPTAVRIRTGPQPGKRSYTTYRIPESTALRVYERSARHESDGSRSFIFCGLNLKVCNTLRRGGPMPDPLPPLVDDRSTLLRQIAELGDFQPGSITSATRRCGSSACHCAKPNDPGHGPHFQLTQKVDGKTVTQNLPSLVAVRKAESEIAEFRKFQTLTGELVDV